MYLNGDGATDSPRPGVLADRLPPMNLGAEAGVIGSVLVEPAVMNDVADVLTAEDFYRDAHQAVWRAMLELWGEGLPCDAVMVCERLTRHGTLAAAGGAEALALMVADTPSSANARYYADIVRERSAARRLVDASNETLREAYAGRHTADELLEAAERRVFAIADGRAAGDTVAIGDAAGEASDRIHHRARNRHYVTGLTSGFIDLDDMTGGFEADQLIIIAARPSAGKTALALNVGDHAAEGGIGVLFVSLEMGKLELAERLICARSRVDGHKLRTGQNLSDADLARVRAARESLRACPMAVDVSPTRNMLQITANARRLRARDGIGLVVVDYIQLVDCENGRDSRQEQVAKVSRRLKTLAREMHVPVVALSQLNRKVEDRADFRPRMSDLRESGAIEQDADMVLLLHRPDYYDANDQPGVAEVIVAKNRSGPTGTVKLVFHKPYARFENFSPAAEPPIDTADF
jgi:replicative DNA helicase